MGSQRPNLSEACSVSQTEPSGAAMAEWTAAVPSFGTGKSCISAVFGLRRVILFPIPKFGIQTDPSLAGDALNGMRLGPGISYSTYAMFMASLEKGLTVSLYPGNSAGDFGNAESSP